MYRIVDSGGRTVAFASRKEDAVAMINTQLDGNEYKIIVDTSNK